MKYLSLFSGIGGFELGIMASNACQPECIGYSEIDKYAIQIYEKHFNHKNYEDITKIKAEQLPEFEMLVGGFPCQAFSIAGKRRGFEDTRGTLFFDIARILKAKFPRLFILENVKGLLSHDKGRTFRTIITTLDELRYDLQWQVLNSKNFGVPQNRERVFIIGHLRGTGRPKVFPFRETMQSSDKQNKEGGAGLKCLYDGDFQSHRVYGIDGNSPTIPTSGGGHHIPFIAKTIRVGGQRSLTKKHNWDSYKIDGKIRRLTPTECERLQGFPDGWTEGVSDTQRYKTLGNAVTVNVVKEIIERIIK